VSSASRPARRNEASHRAILDAALALCRERGYAKLTVEAIAARAGVGKQTIYRWWPSKGAVVIDAFLREVGEEISFPDTGDLAADIRAVLTNVARLSAHPGWGPHMAALICEAQHDPAVRHALLDRFITPRRAPIAELLQRAQQAGELPPTLDIRAVLDLLFGAIYHRLLLRNAPLDNAYAATVAEIVLAGCRSGTKTS
jgi:AcrR family transcriptional regulator